MPKRNSQTFNYDLTQNNPEANEAFSRLRSHLKELENAGLHGLQVTPMVVQHSMGGGVIKQQIPGLKVSVPDQLDRSKTREMTFISPGGGALMLMGTSSRSGGYAVVNQLGYDQRDASGRSIIQLTDAQTAAAMVNRSYEGASIGTIAGEFGAEYVPLSKIRMNPGILAWMKSAVNVTPTNRQNQKPYDSDSVELIRRAAEINPEAYGGKMVSRPGKNIWWNANFNKTAQFLVKGKRFRQSTSDVTLAYDPKTGEPLPLDTSPLSWRTKIWGQEVAPAPQLMQRSKALVVEHSPFANAGATPSRIHHTGDSFTKRIKGFRSGATPDLASQSVTWADPTGATHTVSPGDYFADKDLYPTDPADPNYRKRLPTSIARKMGIDIGHSRGSIFHGFEDKGDEGYEVSTTRIRTGTRGAKLGTKMELQDVTDRALRYNRQGAGDPTSKKSNADLIIHRPQLSDKETIPYLERMFVSQIFEQNQGRSRNDIIQDMGSQLMDFFVRRKDDTGIKDDTEIQSIVDEFVNKGTIDTRLRAKGENVSSIWGSFLADWGQQREQKLIEFRHRQISKEVYMGYTHPDPNDPTKRVSNTFEFNGQQHDILGGARPIKMDKTDEIIGYSVDTFRTRGFEAMYGLTVRPDPSKNKASLSPSTMSMHAEYKPELFENLSTVALRSRKGKQARSLAVAYALNKLNYTPVDTQNMVLDIRGGLNSSDLRVANAAKAIGNLRLSAPADETERVEALADTLRRSKLGDNALHMEVGGENVYLPAVNEILGALTQTDTGFEQNWALGAAKLLGDVLGEGPSGEGLFSPQEPEQRAAMRAEWARSAKYDLAEQLNSRSYARRGLGLEYDAGGWNGTVVTAGGGLPSNSVMISKDTFMSALKSAPIDEMAQGFYDINPKGKMNSAITKYLSDMDFSAGQKEGFFDSTPGADEAVARKQALDQLATDGDFQKTVLSYLASGRDKAGRSSLWKALQSDAKNAMAQGEFTPFSRHPFFNPDQTTVGTRTFVYEPERWNAMARTRMPKNATPEQVERIGRRRAFGKAMSNFASIYPSPEGTAYASPDLLMQTLGDYDGDKVAVLGSVMFQAIAARGIDATRWNKQTKEERISYLRDTVNSELPKLYTDVFQQEGWDQTTDSMYKKLSEVEDLASDPRKFVNEILSTEFGGRGSIGKVYNLLLRRANRAAQHSTEGLQGGTQDIIKKAFGKLHTLASQKLVDLSNVADIDQPLADVVDFMNASFQMKNKGADIRDGTLRVNAPISGTPGSIGVLEKNIPTTLANLLVAGSRGGTGLEDIPMDWLETTQDDMFNSLPPEMQKAFKGVNEEGVKRISAWAKYTAEGTIPLALGSGIIGAVEASGGDPYELVRSVIGEVGSSIFEMDKAGDIAPLDLDKAKVASVEGMARGIRGFVNSQAAPLKSTLESRFNMGSWWKPSSKAGAPDEFQEDVFRNSFSGQTDPAKDIVNYAAGNAMNRATTRMSEAGKSAHSIVQSLKAVLGGRYDEASKYAENISAQEEYRQSYERGEHGFGRAIAATLSPYAPPAIRRHVEKAFPASIRAVLADVPSGSMFEGDEGAAAYMDPSLREGGAAAVANPTFAKRFFGLFTPLSRTQREAEAAYPPEGSSGVKYRPEDDTPFGPSPSVLGTLYKTHLLTEKSIASSQYGFGSKGYARFVGGASTRGRAKAARAMEQLALSAAYNLPSPERQGHDKYTSSLDSVLRSSIYNLRGIFGDQRMADIFGRTAYRNLPGFKGRKGNFSLSYEQTPRENVLTVDGVGTGMNLTSEKYDRSTLPITSGDSHSEVGDQTESGIARDRSYSEQSSGYTTLGDGTTSVNSKMVINSLDSEESLKIPGGMVDLDVGGKQKSAYVSGGKIDFVGQNVDTGGIRIEDSKAIQAEKIVAMSGDPNAAGEYTAQQILYTKRFQSHIEEARDPSSGAIDPGKLSGAALELHNQGVLKRDTKVEDPVLLLTAQIYRQTDVEKKDAAGKLVKAKELSPVSADTLFEEETAKGASNIEAYVRVQKVVAQRKVHLSNMYDEAAGKEKDAAKKKKLADTATMLRRDASSILAGHDKLGAASTPAEQAASEDEIRKRGINIPDVALNVSTTDASAQQFGKWFTDIPSQVAQFKPSVMTTNPRWSTIAHNISAAVAPYFKALKGLGSYAPDMPDDALGLKIPGAENVEENAMKASRGALDALGMPYGADSPGGASTSTGGTTPPSGGPPSSGTPSPPPPPTPGGGSGGTTGGTPGSPTAVGSGGTVNNYYTNDKYRSGDIKWGGAKFANWQQAEAVVNRAQESLVALGKSLNIVSEGAATFADALVDVQKNFDASKSSHVNYLKKLMDFSAKFASIDKTSFQATSTKHPQDDYAGEFRNNMAATGLAVGKFAQSSLGIQGALLSVSGEDGSAIQRQIEGSEDPGGYFRAALFGGGRRNSAVRRELRRLQQTKGTFKNALTDQDENYFKLGRLSPEVTGMIGGAARIADRATNFMWLTQHAKSYMLDPQFQAAQQYAQSQQSITAQLAASTPGNLGALDNKYQRQAVNMAAYDRGFNRATYNSMSALYGQFGGEQGYRMGGLSFLATGAMAGAMIGGIGGPGGALGGGILGAGLALGLQTISAGQEGSDYRSDALRDAINSRRGGRQLDINEQWSFLVNKAFNNFTPEEITNANVQAEIDAAQGIRATQTTNPFALRNLASSVYGYGTGEYSKSFVGEAMEAATRAGTGIIPAAGPEQVSLATYYANTYGAMGMAAGAMASPLQATSPYYLSPEFRDFLEQSTLIGVDMTQQAATSMAVSGSAFPTPEGLFEQGKSLEMAWSNRPANMSAQQFWQAIQGVLSDTSYQMDDVISRRVGADPLPIGERILRLFELGDQAQMANSLKYLSDQDSLYGGASTGAIRSQLRAGAYAGTGGNAPMSYAERENQVWATSGYLGLMQSRDWAGAQGFMSLSDFGSVYNRFEQAAVNGTRRQTESVLNAIGAGNPYAITAAYRAGLTNPGGTDVLRSDPRFEMVNLQTGMNPYYENVSPGAAALLMPQRAQYLSGTRFASMNDPYAGMSQKQLQQRQFALSDQSTVAQRGYRDTAIQLDYAMTTGDMGTASNIFGKLNVTLTKSTAAVDALAKRLGVNTAGGVGAWQAEDISRFLGREQQGYALAQEGRQQALQGQDLERQLRQFMESFGLNQRQFQYQTGFQREQMQIERGMQLTERKWTGEDLSLQRSQMEVGFAWQQEDFDRGIRYSRGREKRDLMRQQQRSVIQYAMQMTNQQRQEERYGTRNEWADTLFERTKANFEQMTKFTEEEMALNKKHFLENLKQDEKRFELAKEYHEKQLQWFEEEKAIQDLTIAQSRESTTYQLELQKSQIATFDAIEDSMTQITANLQAQTIQLAESQAWIALQVATGEIFKRNAEETNAKINEIGASITSLSTYTTGFAVSTGAAAVALSLMTGNISGLVTAAGQLMMQLAAGIQSAQQAAQQQATQAYQAYRAGERADYSGGSGDGYTWMDIGGTRMRVRIGTGFAEGGYTGDGPKYQPKGIVHAGEYVIPEEGSLVRYNKEDSENLKELVRLMRIVADKETSFSAVINGDTGSDKMSFFDRTRARL